MFKQTNNSKHVPSFTETFCESLYESLFMKVFLFYFRKIKYLIGIEHYCSQSNLSTGLYLHI